MGRRDKILLFLAVFWFCLVGGVDSSIKFEITISNNKISLGQTAQLNLSFYGSQDVPPPKIEIENFEVNYLGPSTQISIINGRVSSSITHIYSLLPLKIGKFKIGPLNVNYKGKTLTSNQLEIEVVKSPSPSGDEKEEEDNSLGLKDRVFLIIQPEKRQIFLNELISLKVSLYIDNLAVKDIEYPQLTAENFSLKGFSQPQQYKKQVGGKIFDVLEFDTRIYPLSSGEFKIFSTLKCNLLVRKQEKNRLFPFGDFFDDDFFRDFFGFYQTRSLTLKSPEVLIEVKPYPSEGKPQDFQGAVGDFNLDVEVSPQEVNVGDPITLTMVVKGEGNFDSVNCPVLENTSGFKIYEPEVKEESGRKIFKQVLIPQEVVKEVPSVKFSFLNPSTSKYQTLSKGPFPVKVIPVPVSMPQVVAPSSNSLRRSEEVGRDIVYIKTDLPKLRKKGAFLYKSPVFWLFNIFMFLLFLGSVSFYKHKQRLKSDKNYLRKIWADNLSKKFISYSGKREVWQDKKSLDELFREFSQYLSFKLNLAPGEVAIENIKRIFKEKKLDESILNKIEKVFSVFELARFTPQELRQEDRTQVEDDLREIVNYLKRKKV